jgi:tetratricopeptide (TPR) repeat protein
VASLPAPWAERLLPIPDSDLSGAEPAIRQAITEARATIAGLLDRPDADPNRLAQAYGRLGALLVLREVDAPADAAFRNARDLEPDAFRWPYYAGYLAMMTGNDERALELFEAARALDPDYPTLYLRLGKVHLDRSELPEASANFERIAAVPGLEAAAHFYLGQIANLERRYQDAVAHLTKTLEKDPAATEAQWPLAQAYRALGQDDLAREHMALVEPRTPPAKDPLLEQLQGAAEQSVPAFERAIYAVDKRDYRTAAAEFAAGLEVAPANWAARVSYARVLYLTGDREAAEAELDRVLAAEPEQTLALFLKAALAQQDGDRERAAALYRRVLELEPSHPGALYYLANLDFEQGRWAEAATGYRRTLAAEDAPAPASLLAIVAEHHAGAGEERSAEGIAALTNARPEDPALRYAQIRLLVLANDPALRDAKRALELAQLLSFQQPSPQALRTLALAHAGAGDFDTAAATQGQAILMAGGWLPPAMRELMDRELAAYRDERLEGEPWPAGDPLIAPPPFDPTGPFRDYPAAVPY